jgi:putative spermidine/putrescine transport system ATP-binding protein
MAFLELQEITRRFGHTIAVDQISLTVEQGEFLTLLGPSGCGKTTLLRMIAGFETPSNGRILLEGEDITYRAASKRPMGMVFQSYALFPHMTAEQNIAFGMSIKKLPREVIRKRCAELLDLVGLADRGKSYPHQLSGGQQQRIALARALAVEPKLLLLDEPLSALDARVRVALRNEIRRIQQQLKMTAIYVTHDQEEALSISDRIAVMARGRIEQLDHPEEIYGNPRTIFVAGFVGTSNQLRAVLEAPAQGRCRIDRQLVQVPPVAALSAGQAVLLLVRPEEVTLRVADVPREDRDAALGNALAGVIELRTFLGPFVRFQVRTDEGALLTADVPSQQARDFSVAQRVLLTFPPDACQVLPLEGQEMGLMKEAETV